MGAEGAGELHAHVAEATEADDADLLPGADLPMAQRRVGGDTGAEQRGGGGQVEPGGDAQGEGLVDHDVRGVAPEGVPAEVLVRAVVGEGRPREAELLEAFLAARAGAAGVDHAAGRADVAHLQLGDLGADLRDPSDNLMAGDAGVVRAGPLAARGMDVGMADAAEENLHLDVGRAGGAPGDRQRGEGILGGGVTVGAGGGGHGGDLGTWLVPGRTQVAGAVFIGCRAPRVLIQRRPDFCYTVAMKPPSLIDADPLDTVLRQTHHPLMKTITYASARRRLAGLIESVQGGRKPVMITRRGVASVVLVDAGEFAAMSETIHLLSSSRNSARLRRGLADFKAGKFRAL